MLNLLLIMVSGQLFNLALKETMYFQRVTIFYNRNLKSIALTFAKSFVGLGLLLSISVVQAAQSVVSLDLCTDWMLLKYASPSQHITFSPLLYQNPPHWVPQDLAVHDGSLEQLLELNPDLILSGEFNALILRKRLRQLEMNVVTLPMPDTLEKITEYSHSFESVVAVNKAFVQDMRSPAYPRKNLSLLLVGSNGIGTGRATLEHEVLSHAGYDNYLTSQGFVALDLEKLLLQPPDVIISTSQYADTPSLANLFIQHKAVSRSTPIEYTPAKEIWAWQCPGPWTFDLVNTLAVRDPS